MLDSIYAIISYPVKSGRTKNAPQTVLATPWGAQPNGRLTVDSVPPFDESRFYLGKLCPQSHNYQGSQKSLRYKNDRACVGCSRVTVLKANDLESLPGELWKPIAGFEGIYEVSQLGRIKRTAWGRGASPCILKTPLSNSGYLFVGLRQPGLKKRGFFVHTLVLEAFSEPRAEGSECNHIDGCKTNNRINNLEWASHSENLVHAHATGLYGRTKR